MTPEEIGQPAPSPEPEPAPPPPAPPEPSPAPPPEAAAEPSVDSGQFNAMASLLSRDTPSLDSLVGDTAPATPRERKPRPEAPVSPPPEAPSLPAQPAPEGPKRWGGAYDTPEALERAYKDVLDRNARTEQAAQRLERLLLASLEGRQAQPGQPAAPTPAPRPIAPSMPWDRQTAIAAIKEESARLGLDDPQADPQRYYRAMTAAMLQDDETRGQIVAAALEAMRQQTEQQRQVQTLQTAFYTQYPDLREVRPELLRQVAQETEARLYRANPEVYGSPEYVQQWFNETAREARAVFRVSPVSGTEGNGQASAPTQPQSPSKAPSEKPKGAPFSESPSPRPSEPTLSGQALHLARVFGRPG